MEASDLKTLLQSCSLFKKLKDSELNILIHHGRTRLFPRGEDIYQKGEPSRGTFCMIIVGQVGVFAEDGQIIAGLGPGEIIGEVGVTSPQNKRTVTVRTIEKTEVMEWNVNTIKADLPIVFKRLKDLSWKRVSNYYER